jgi:spermidine synthase
MSAALKLARIDSAYAVLGSVIADAAALRRFSDGAPVNTDDLPAVAHRAARVDYAPEALPRERLGALLRILPEVPAGALDERDPNAARLAAYWQARARYLALGLQTRTDPDPRVMLDALGPDLLALVAASPQFQPAADSLAGLAQALQGSDYSLSQQVLAQLRRVQDAPETAAAPTPSIPSDR